MARREGLGFFNRVGKWSGQMYCSGWVDRLDALCGYAVRTDEYCAEQGV